MSTGNKVIMTVVGENPNFNAEELKAEIENTWGVKVSLQNNEDDKIEVTTVTKYMFMGKPIGKGNRTLNIDVADNGYNLEELGYDSEKFIDEMVQRTYEMGTIWIHSDEAHKYYIQHFLTMEDVQKQIDELFEEHELDEYKEEEEEEEDLGYLGSDYPDGAMGYDR